MMNTNTKAQILNSGTPYYVVPKSLLSAKHLVDTQTGEIVPLTMGDKLVLLYLIDKVSFHNSEGRTMHESMPAIAEQLDMSAKTVQRSVQKLVKHNVVSATIVSASKGYVYHSVDFDQQWNKGEVSVSNKERMKPNPINVPTTNAPDVRVQASESLCETFTDSTPDVGMPEHMQAPVFDYSDVFSHMADSDSEPRVGVYMVG